MLNNLRIRNYKNLDLDLIFENKITLVLAENGAGKTNLLESIFYISNGFDFGKTDDKNSLNKESKSSQFFISANFALQNKNNSQIAKTIIYEWNERSNKKYVINEKKKTSKQFNESTKSIIFSPESIDLITGNPEGRRSELDNLLKLSSKEYYDLTTELENILKNRNKHLKFLSKAPIQNSNVSNDKIYEFWTKRLIDTSEKIIFHRTGTIAKLNIISNNLSNIYHFGENKFEIIYVTKSMKLESFEDYKNTLTNTIKENFFKEIVNGSTMYGPHRDDIAVYLNGKLIREYGSRAQQRIASFIIKLSEIEYLELENIGKDFDNILLLDDIPSELDTTHIRNIENHLLKLDLQIIMTATSSSFFSEDFISKVNLLNLF